MNNQKAIVVLFARGDIRVNVFNKFNFGNVHTWYQVKRGVEYKVMTRNLLTNIVASLYEKL